MKSARVIIAFLCFFVQLCTGSILLGEIRYPEFGLSYYLGIASLIQYVLGAASFTAILYFLSPVFEDGFKYKRFLSFLTLIFLGLSAYPAYLHLWNIDDNVQKANLYYVGIGGINLALAIFCVVYLLRHRLKSK